ncbi:ubiquitin 1 [Tritrichomonas foetus]|uniref:Ubiquitin 1 n=1 Tax=Tritrichomonas foetus TaxID=1144522 RepID=A0A1J4JMZ7_9EUKA|nr:ubiquitin 1 [Tritrichomonas foetus]|eukprot:OHT00495.1 ubiquitin 1 [Tritrichomonas foetus]
MKIENHKVGYHRKSSQKIFSRLMSTEPPKSDPTLIINDKINFTKFKVSISLFQSTIELKKKIEENNNIPLAEQRLIFLGKLLSDDFSLAYYGIRDKSVIFLIAKKAQSPPRQTPSRQILRLTQLIEQYYNSKLNDYQEVLTEITEIIQNPMVKAAARINSEFQLKIEEAHEILQTAEHPISTKNVMFIAKAHDMTLTHFESTPDGFRFLQSLIKDEESLSAHSSFQIPTNLCYQTELSNKPLPQCWNRPRNCHGGNYLLRNQRVYKRFGTQPLFNLSDESEKGDEND